MNVNSYRILPETTASGTRYRVDGNHTNGVESSDAVLVRSNGESWEPVAELPSNVDRFTTEETFGTWEDKEISHREGWFWNRRKVIDRPKDGKIDQDEVSGLGFRRFDSGRRITQEPDNFFRVGSEIADKGYGPTLDIHYQGYGPYRVIGGSDISKLEDYRADDANWRVPTK